MGIRHGVYDHDTPAKFTSTEAWIHGGAGWQPIHVAQILWAAGVLTQAELERWWPSLPPLPSHAVRN
jgi:hypothetical protein